MTFRALLFQSTNTRKIKIQLVFLVQGDIIWNKEELVFNLKPIPNKIVNNCTCITTCTH